MALIPVMTSQSYVIMNQVPLAVPVAVVMSLVRTASVWVRMNRVILFTLCRYARTTRHAVRNIFGIFVDESLRSCLFFFRND